MFFVDNMVKAWLSGMVVGDKVFGYATATPGLIIDGTLNTMLSNQNQYEFTSIDYSTVEYITATRFFAAPGKLIGNAVSPFVFCALALADFLPNLILRTVDRFYESAKDRMDEAVTFLSTLATERQDLNYLQKSYYSGYAILGNLLGCVIGFVGRIIDTVCSLFGLDTGGAVKRACFSGGSKVGGVVGGVIASVIGAALYPVKKIIDTIFSVFRKIRRVVDKIAANLIAKGTGCPVDLRTDPTDPRIFSESFRDEMTEARRSPNRFGTLFDPARDMDLCDRPPGYTAAVAH